MAPVTCHIFTYLHREPLRLSSVSLDAPPQDLTPNGPAAKSGLIHPGDLLIAVDGLSSASLNDMRTCARTQPPPPESGGGAPGPRAAKSPSPRPLSRFVRRFITGLEGTEVALTMHHRDTHEPYVARMKRAPVG
jgi:hypothetical protein